MQTGAQKTRNVALGALLRLVRTVQKVAPLGIGVNSHSRPHSGLRVVGLLDTLTALRS